MMRFRAKMNGITSLVVVLVVFFCACGRTNDRSTESSDSEVDTLVLSYAEGFSVDYAEDYKQVCVYNPGDQGQVLATYYLVADSTVSTPADGLRLQVPLGAIAISSATHVEPLRMLGELDDVLGMCTPQLVYNSTLRERYARGEVHNLGDAMAMSVEQSLALNPTALFMSGYGSSDNFTEHLEQVGIPIVYNNEWMERTLLARAEWLKFMAVFWNKEHEADSLFRVIDERYMALKQRIALVEDRPSIMTGGNFRGTWYMPAGDNYMARLFADAGGDYRYAGDESTGSLPLTIEEVIFEFAEADVWLGSSANTLDELIAMDKKHAYFKPYKEHEVYNFNARTTKSGANDFWEMGVGRPDLVLADVMKVLHPELMTDHEFVFVRKLE